MSEDLQHQQLNQLELYLVMDGSTQTMQKLTFTLVERSLKLPLVMLDLRDLQVLLVSLLYLILGGLVLNFL
jgi:hypothetical protein